MSSTDKSSVAVGHPGLAVDVGSGSDALWTWFGIGRASFLIMPRVLMHEMPDAWQAKMAALLEEYDETFTNWPDDFDGVRAQLTKNGKCVRTPEWLRNYRCPDKQAINSLRPNVRPEPRGGQGSD